MKRVYEFQNGIVEIVIPDIYNKENFVKKTEDFLKKVISEVNNNGNSDTCRDFREK